MDKIIQFYFILYLINYFLVQKSFNYIKNSYALMIWEDKNIYIRKLKEKKMSNFIQMGY